MSIYRVRVEMSLKDGGTLRRALEKLPSDNLTDQQCDMHQAFLAVLGQQIDGGGVALPEPVRPRWLKPVPMPAR